MGTSDHYVIRGDAKSLRNLGTNAVGAGIVDKQSITLKENSFVFPIGKSNSAGTNVIDHTLGHTGYEAVTGNMNAQGRGNYRIGITYKKLLIFHINLLSILLIHGFQNFNCGIGELLGAVWT